jgi:hypothetical protein
VTNNVSETWVRRAARALALTPAVLVLAAAGPAFATAPEQWGHEPVSPLHALLVLVVIPVGLFVLITLLVYVPSLARGERYQPGLAWRNEPEWFGGPSRGVEAADEAPPVTVDEARDNRGGGSASW